MVSNAASSGGGSMPVAAAAATLAAAAFALAVALVAPLSCWESMCKYITSAALHGCIHKSILSRMPAGMVACTQHAAQRAQRCRKAIQL